MSEYIGKSYKGVKIGGSQDIANALLEDAKVAIVPGVAFGDDTCFRLSYATSMERIVEGMNRIEKMLSEVK
jgi:aspartate aminotransferase